jgi:hypothetical protein
MTNETSYFNIITSGYAYLNKARVVPVSKGQPYLAVTAALLEGPFEDVNYQYFDLTIKGELANQLIEKYMNEINDRDTKVLASIEIGSMYIKSFIYERGPKAGQPGATAKGRLIKISHIKINGQVMYEKPTDDIPASANASHPEPSIDNNEAPAADSNAQLPPEVKLSKEDPNFNEQKAMLKAQGYRWNSDSQSWVLPNAPQEATPVPKQQAA